MSKVMIKTYIKNDQETINISEIKGLLIEDTLKYKYKDELIIFNINTFQFNKENQESILHLDFINQKSKYYIKSTQKELNIDLKIDKIERNQNSIKISYTIENENQFEYYLEWYKL